MSVGTVVYLCGGCLAIPLNMIVRLIPTLLYIYINRLLPGIERHKQDNYGYKKRIFSLLTRKRTNP